MSSRTLNRKDFLILGFSSAALSVLAAACGDDPATPLTSTGGSGGTPSTTGGAGSPSGGMATTGGAGNSSGGAAAGSPSGGGGASAGGGGSGGGGGASGGSGGASGGSGGASGGSSGGGSGGGGGGGKCGADLMVTSTGQHTHTLLITMAQFTAGTEAVIQTGGSNGDPNGHKHWVKVTAADFTMLKAGMEVKKKSCSGGNHEYVLKCGGGASAGVIPDMTACPDADMCGSAMGDACN